MRGVWVHDEARRLPSWRGLAALAAVSLLVAGATPASASSRTAACGAVALPELRHLLPSGEVHAGEVRIGPPVDATLDGVVRLVDGVRSSVTVARATTPSIPATGTAGATATVTLPAGAITITTPYDATHPLDLGSGQVDGSGTGYSASAPLQGIVVTDRRAGNLGFTVTIGAGPFRSGSASFDAGHAGLTDLVVTQLPGNGLQATDVTVVDHPPATDGLASAKAFATYPAGLSIGSAHIDGVFGVDQVPTSIPPGTYVSLVTLTAF